MAIKVEGFFKNPINGQIFESPILAMVPHLVTWGNILLDVNILNKDEELIGAFSIDINKNNLVYPIGDDAYTNLIKAIESNILTYLPTSNEINSSAIYSNYIKILTNVNEENIEIL
jgi:hypothetical protein